MLLESDANRDIGGLTTLPDEPVREAAAAAAAAAALQRKKHHKVKYQSQSIFPSQTFGSSLKFVSLGNFVSHSLHPGLGFSSVVDGL